MKKLFVATSVCFAICTLAAVVNAGQLIDVGLASNNALGAGVIYNSPLLVGAGTDQWNHFGTGNQGPVSLFDTSGNATGVSATIVANNGGGTSNTSPNTSITHSYDWTLSASNPITVTLTGLTPGAYYDLYAISVSDSGGAARPGLVAAAAANGGASEAVAGNFTLSTWVSGQNYTSFYVEADKTGTVVFTDTLTSMTDMETDLNGFQLLTVTPEPGSLVALLGAGAIGLLAARRSRRRKKSNG
jgi:hypothetical protein